MTQNNLLLKDLSARLIYGVILKHISTEKPFKLSSIKRDEYASYKKDGVELAMNGIYYDWYVNDKYHNIELYIKPYLRPMSSMTEEEREELRQEQIKDEQLFTDCIKNHPERRGLIVPHFASEWCDKNMFDHRGLIPRGLAIAVTKDNNPYGN